jgi:hypothetical protein
MYKYIFKVEFSEFLELIKWDEICFYILAFILFYGILNWIGIILYPFFIYLTGYLGDGACGESGLQGYFPYEVYPPNTCSANIEDCQICDNPYEHDFNLRYNENLKWWQKIC